MTSWAANLMAFILIVGPAFPGLAQSARLEHVSDGQISSSRLIRKLLPYRIYLEPRIEPGQTAALVAAGESNLLLTAVFYGDDKTNLQPHEQCGIYFIPQKGEQTYVATVGPDYPAACGGTEGIGLMTDGGPRPRLIVLCSTYSGVGDRAVIPFILGWVPEKNMYQLDHSTSDWLLRQPGATDTIAKVRRMLALYDKSKVQAGHK